MLSFVSRPGLGAYSSLTVGTLASLSVLGGGPVGILGPSSAGRGGALRFDSRHPDARARAPPECLPYN